MSYLGKLAAFVFVAVVLVVRHLATPAIAEVIISVAPPILPVYRLPIIPGPDYIWAPGYWSYDNEDDDYYWVPGTWVLAPEPGLLWTPGYWGCDEGRYFWHAGYWGPHVGFYGGINYGFGYGGYGYEGGHWDHGAFYYNTAVYHVNTTIIHNTYSKSVTYNKNVTKVSFNGGQGGTNAKPSGDQLKADKEKHVGPTSLQTDHQHSAKGNRDLFAKVNHGKPLIAATAKPGVFTGNGVTATKGEKSLSQNKSTGSSPNALSGKTLNGVEHKNHKTLKSVGSPDVGSMGGTHKTFTPKPNFTPKVTTHIPTQKTVNTPHAHPPQHHAPPPQHRPPPPPLKIRKHLASVEGLRSSTADRCRTPPDVHRNPVRDLRAEGSAG